jgi:glutamate dehydrogenase
MNEQSQSGSRAQGPGTYGDIPAGFEDALFAGADEEDLQSYGSADRHAIVTCAWEGLAAPRAPAAAAIRLHDLALSRNGRARDVTILEVVNDNMPFLLDSTLAELDAQGLQPLLVAHPIVAVERGADGGLLRFAGPVQPSGQAGLRRESLIHIHLDRIDGEAAERLRAELGRTYADIRLAVRDWPAMRSRLAQIVHAWRTDPPPLPDAEIREAVAFVEWLAADNFTLLGVREVSFPGADLNAEPVESAGLGILADPAVKVLRRGRELVAITPEIRAFLSEPVPLIVTKASVKSRVHRRVHLDYVGVKQFGPDGRLAGELQVVGLFTSSAYTETTGAIPLVRRKVAQVIERAGFDPASHSGRALTNVLESYPRDELFQIDPATLLDFARDILNLYERPRVRVLARPDRFDRFVSLLVFIPKDRYDTRIRQEVGETLARLYQGRFSAAYPAYPEGPLARTHYIVGRYEGVTPAIDRATAEAAVGEVVRTWADGLREALADSMSGDNARALAGRYSGAFSAAYREAFAPVQALADLAVIERLGPGLPFTVRVEPREGGEAGRLSLKVFSRGRAMPLSERVPLLEHLGFRVINERTYRVRPAGEDAEETWLHDTTLELDGVDVVALKPRVEAALIALLRNEAESDGYNALVVRGGLGWREVALIRTLSRFLQQARVPFSQDYMSATLVRHALLARDVVDLFTTRFDPSAEAVGDRESRQQAVRARIEQGLAAVTSLDEDRILRHFVNLVEAAIRTSFFQLGPDGRPRGTIAVKFESGSIDGLPAPRPLYEIVVYSPQVEGVHLRFGKVARGGLRWSDRKQDFRTEVLGLVKAQQVKNAVIVPVGAKGGFVPKRLPPPGDRQAWMDEGIAAYREFVSTLLDLTDNIVGDAIVPPPLTVRHDGDDPYLVVAADKGTATFSDIANAISIEHGHWLGDAFASGGSHGYDHKKMGITARGAWEAVKRHFREMDVDIQETPFTVAGVGDMSGDVFGNGMLLSRHIRLVAAFDHRDIFLDPDPDTEASWSERKRLFELPRSSWADYDKALISAGGGIFSRSAKSIPLTPPLKVLLGLTAEQATPPEVMRAILKARVDLLWFGGIGTYIRASTETDEQAGDRANDAIRITGADVQARVVGEGANLGVTQLGRIEAARQGVRINTDAIDNSAGVNTSDVEVNIKIALATPERDGVLRAEDRDVLLSAMTDEVAGLVLRNNYLQTLALSLAQLRGGDDFGYQRRLVRLLETQGRLDRTVEFLPDEAQLSDRASRAETLTRPELAVLLAYAKLALHDALLDSPVPDDPHLARELVRYFPQSLVERFPDAIQSHRLRREIIATQLANAIVNRGGPTVIVRIADQTGADAPLIAAAYAATRDSYDLMGFNAAIDALDGKVAGAVQLGLYRQVQDLMLSRTVWFIRNVDLARETIDSVVARYRTGIAEVEASMNAALDPSQRERAGKRAAELMEQGVPEQLAVRVALLLALESATDIVFIATRSERPIAMVAANHFAVAKRFRLADIVLAAREVAVSDYYDRLALDRAVSTIAAAHRALTTEVSRRADVTGAAAVDAWAVERGPDVERLSATVEAIAGSGLTLSKATVAASLLADLARV